MYSTIEQPLFYRMHFDILAARRWCIASVLVTLISPLLGLIAICFAGRKLRASSKRARRSPIFATARGQKLYRSATAWYGVARFFFVFSILVNAVFVVATML